MHLSHIAPLGETGARSNCWANLALDTTDLFDFGGAVGALAKDVLYWLGRVGLHATPATRMSPSHLRNLDWHLVGRSSF